MATLGFVFFGWILLYLIQMIIQEGYSGQELLQTPVQGLIGCGFFLVLPIICFIGGYHGFWRNFLVPFHNRKVERRKEKWEEEESIRHAAACQKADRMEEEETAKAKRKFDKYKENREKELETLINSLRSDSQKRIDGSNQIISYLSSEKSKVSKQLQAFYDMGILAKPYWTLTYACYIYDYISTQNNSTLELALMHAHMENGIQRIEMRLDRIQSAIEVQIRETRCLRYAVEELTRIVGKGFRQVSNSIDSSTERVSRELETGFGRMEDHLSQVTSERAKNDIRMLEQLERSVQSQQRIERNTEKAAAYARLSAQHAAANEYYAYANYYKE